MGGNGMGGVRECGAGGEDYEWEVGGGHSR